MPRWSCSGRAIPEATSGVYGAFEGTIRRQWLKELGIPWSTSTRSTTTRRRFSAASGSRRGRPRTVPWRWRSPMSGSPRICTTRSMWRSAPSASRSGRPTSSARRTASRRRRSGRRRRPASPRTRCVRWRGVGQQEDLPRRRRPRRLRRRLPLCHRHRMGALHGLSHGHAGPGQARRQHGLPAAGHAAGHHFFFPGYAEGGFSGDLYGTALSINMYQRMPQLPTVNTVNQVDPATQDPRGHPGRPRARLPHRRQVHRRSVPALRVPGAGPQRDQAVLQVRRLAFRHHDRDQPLRAHVPVGQAGVRRQPVHLV